MERVSDSFPLYKGAAASAAQPPRPYKKILLIALCLLLIA